MRSSNRRFEILLAIAIIGAWLFFEFPGTALRWLLSDVVDPAFYAPVSDETQTSRIVYFRAFAALAGFYLAYELFRWFLPRADATSEAAISAVTPDRSTPAGKIASLALQLKLNSLLCNFVLNRDRARQGGYSTQPHLIWVYSEVGMHGHVSGSEHDFTQTQTMEFLAEAKRYLEQAKANSDVANRLAKLERLGIVVEHETFSHERKAGYFVRLSDFETRIASVEHSAAAEAGYHSTLSRAFAWIKFRLWMKRTYGANYRLWRALVPFDLKSPY